MDYIDEALAMAQYIQRVQMNKSPFNGKFFPITVISAYKLFFLFQFKINLIIFIHYFI